MAAESISIKKLTARYKSLTVKKRNDYISAYLMILPVTAGLTIFYIIPFFQTFCNSFLEMGAFGIASWNGINNYKSLITDIIVWEALRNTIVYAVISVPVGICFSMLLAVLLNADIKGRQIYRVLFFLPCVTMPAAIAMAWKWLYNSSYGLINSFLALFGIKGPSWATDPGIALYSIILVGIWSSIGYNMIILLAGLQGIPGSYYEAAEMDGAGRIWSFFSITLPLLTSTIFFVVIMALINAFQVFDVIFMMIPKDSIAIESTESLVYLYYRSGFIFNDKGYASAIAILIFFLILIVTIIQMKLQNKWVYYD